MSDWEKSKLSAVINIIGGGTPKRSEKKYWNGNIPWLSVADFNDDSRFVYSSAEYITELGLSKSSTKLLKKGDLIISARGTVGCLAQLHKPMAFNQSCYGLNGKDEIIDNGFLYYFLKNNIKELKQKTHGAVFDTITRDTFEQIEICYPNIEYQKEIVKILGDLDQKIHLNQQINQTLEHIAQTIFKSWFVDFDPVYAKANALADGQSMEEAVLSAMSCISGKTLDELHQLQSTNPKQYQQLQEIAQAFPSSFDGEVPRGWGILPLDKIANYQNGLALQKFRPEKENEYLPVVKIAQLRQGFADGAEKASTNIKPECIIDNGDVIFSWSGTLLVDIWCGGKGALNQHLFKVTSKNHPKWFYYLWTCHHLAEFQRIASDKAVTMGHIKKEHLSQALCFVPENNFFNYCNILDNGIDKIISLRLENFNLKTTRDTLLPKLLSGEIKV